MIRRSLNEIELMVRKAGVGAAWPVGLAEDAGQAAAWLCAHGYDGAAAALACIADGPREISVRREQAALLFHDAQALRAGPSGLDLLAAGEEDDCAHFLNLDAPLMLLGLAGILSARYDIALSLEFASGAQAGVSADGLHVSGALVEQKGDVMVRRSPELRVTCVQFDAASGSIVDADAWEKLERLAAKTYVPESEESRLRGAGAGLLDND